MRLISERTQNGQDKSCCTWSGEKSGIKLVKLHCHWQTVRLNFTVWEGERERESHRGHCRKSSALCEITIFIQWARRRGEGERRGAETRVGLQTVQSPTALITCNGADDNYNNECREEQQKSEEKGERGRGRQQRNRAADCISSGISAFSSVRTAARAE